MNNAEIISQITNEDVFRLLEFLGGEPKVVNGVIVSTTICHGGDSDKLGYYPDSKRFMCYTHCGNFDIFNLIMKVKNISFIEAVKYIENFFNIGQPIIGEFKKHDDGFDSIIDNPVANLRNRRDKQYKELKVIENESVLQSFYDFYYDGWLKEGISKGVMKQFGIKFSIIDNQVIIPHRNIDGKLVGIRARNLTKEVVDTGKKYIPIYYNGVSYRYPTGLNLYGVDINKDYINHSHQIILFEAEKSVLKMNSYFNGSNAVALNGTMLSDDQVKLIDSLDVNEVIIAVDKEYEHANTEESKEYAKKIFSIFKKLKSKYNVSIIWDKDDLLNHKDSPVDEGKDVFLKLVHERIVI